MKDLIDCIELTIPAKPEYVGVARLTISGIANRMGYSYDDIEDIKIAVSEACTNAIDHAYSETENGTVQLRLHVFHDRMEIFVIDHGRSFDYDDITSHLEPLSSEKSIEQMNEGGLGLFLIETLMDHVDISGDSGVIVKMTKFLRRDEVVGDANKVSTSRDR